MTLEEAIIHCEDVANDRAGCCKDCAEEHRQLAEWLKELKAYREQTGGDLISRKAVMRIVAFECGEWEGLARTIIKAIEQLPPVTPKEEPKMVRCIDCEHLRTMLTQRKHLPGAICASPIWKAVGQEPHVVWHDLYEPIRCDHFEKKEEQNDGTNH